MYVLLLSLKTVGSTTATFHELASWWHPTQFGNLKPSPLL